MMRQGSCKTGNAEDDADHEQPTGGPEAAHHSTHEDEWNRREQHDGADRYLDNAQNLDRERWAGKNGLVPRTQLWAMDRCIHHCEDIMGAAPAGPLYPSMCHSQVIQHEHLYNTFRGINIPTVLRA